MAPTLKLPQCSMHDCPFVSEFQIIYETNKSHNICHLHFAMKYYDLLDSNHSPTFRYNDLTNTRPDDAPVKELLSYMIMAKKNPHKQKHPYKYMTIAGDRVKIDKGIYALVKELNRHGLKTTSCCQSTDDGTKYVAFTLGKNVHVSVAPLGQKQNTELILLWSKPDTNVREQ